MTRHLRPTPARLAAAVLAALVVALGLLAAAPATPAGAHDGDAVIDVEAAHPAGTSVHYIVRVTWQDDGHPATGATVTATGVAADGTQLTPVTLAPQDEDGRYAGLVDYPEPGNWTVRITAIEPTGTVEQAQVVSPPATTAPAESGDSGDEATDGTTDEGGFAPADDGTGASSADDDGETASSESADDDGGMPVYLLVAAFVIVIVGAVTSVSVIRRNRPDLAGGPGGGPDTGDDGEGPGGDGGPAGGAPDATTDDDPPASASTGGTASTS